MAMMKMTIISSYAKINNAKPDYAVCKLYKPTFSTNVMAKSGFPVLHFVSNSIFTPSRDQPEH